MCHWRKIDVVRCLMTVFFWCPSKYNTTTATKKHQFIISPLFMQECQIEMISENAVNFSTTGWKSIWLVRYCGNIQKKCGVNLLCRFLSWRRRLYCRCSFVFPATFQAQVKPAFSPAFGWRLLKRTTARSKHYAGHHLQSAQFAPLKMMLSWGVKRSG